jgi:hypothetical protein
VSEVSDEFASGLSAREAEVSLSSTVAAVPRSSIRIDGRRVGES